MKKNATPATPVQPLRFLQPVLDRAILQIAKKKPEIFERLDTHGGKKFLINPKNLPFVFLLQPNAASPRLSAFKKLVLPAHDAAISGTFLTLFKMVEGKLDGDALFFSRDLSVTGDIEAVVVLRNAIDDTDGSMMEELLPFFTRPLIRLFKQIKKRHAA